MVEILQVISIQRVLGSLICPKGIKQQSLIHKRGFIPFLCSMGGMCPAVITLRKDVLITFVLELFQHWHSEHCNSSVKGNPKVVCAFCRKQWYFSHLILDFLTYLFFAFELRLLPDWEALGNGLLCQDPSLMFRHLTAAGCMHRLSYTAFGHETDQS